MTKQVLIFVVVDVGRYAGGSLKMLDQLQLFECPPFETILSTTDGIHDYVAHDVLERIMSSSQEHEEKLNEIIQAAKEEGSHDDLTAVLLHVNVKR